MSTYFSGSNTQRDAATMLYLKEPLPSSYSEAPVLPGNMMMYMNYASSSGSYSDTLAGNSQQPNSCTDIASVTATNANPSQQEILSDPGGSRIGLHDFSAWKNCGNEMLLMQPAGNAADVVLQGAQTLQGQALSLSLGTHVTPGFQMSSIQCRNPQLGFSSFMGPNQLISGGGSGRNGSFGDNDDSQSKQTRNSEYMHPGFPGNNSDARIDISSYGMSSIARTISNSKYLMAAQQLLDEVVNVRTALKEPNSRKELTKIPKELDGGSKDGSSDPSATGTTANPQDSSKNELSAAEKQELQNKLSKLLSMLDEVDHRYKQYCHQMQIVVSSFDMVAGSGAAKPYTALALQTISRHFRSLRDAINGQIQATRKSLGEQDASANSKGISISRLRYVDQQLRQQRALQQLGMMQQHAWRPQRGLPENAVSILRAWLFEHFLHPYPKDSDKIMLARQTGLTRSQVSNWFINARVRLWKPMVEEMYKEEIGDAEMDSTSSAELVPKATKSDTKDSEDRGGEDAHQTATSAAMEHRMTGKFFDSKFNHKSDAEMCKSITNAAFQNVTHAGTQNSYEEQRPVVDENTIFTDIVNHSHGSSDRFMAAATAGYHMSELERFGNGSGVSLTLGLQHREGGSLPMSVEARHGFGTLRADDVYDTTPSSIGPETTDFDCIDPGNRQHKFGSSNLLHDFVS